MDKSLAEILGLDGNPTSASKSNRDAVHLSL
jgi:hypothetical protein